MEVSLNDDQMAIVNQYRAVLASIRDQFPRSPSSPANPPFMMGGYAGTGKTTSLKKIAEDTETFLANLTNGNVRLCAPTNKAARRASVKSGRKVNTIHWLLGATPRMHLTRHLPDLSAKLKTLQATEGASEKTIGNLISIIGILRQIETLEKRIEAGGPPMLVATCQNQIEKLTEDMTNFPLGEGSITPNDVVLCDESSMVEADMKARVEDKNPALIVWIGDPGQLDPVNGPRWFRPPVETTLTKVMRQGAQSGILKLATEIRNGLANTDMLARRLDGYDDVKFVRASDLDWHELVTDYGDKWLTWRNTQKTKNHPFHPKQLNNAFRIVKGFDNPLPQPGDRLYVTARFSNSCANNGRNPIYLVKGDELIVKSASETGDVTKLTLNASPPTFDALDLAGTISSDILDEHKVRPGKCICAAHQKETGFDSSFICKGRPHQYTKPDGSTSQPNGKVWEMISPKGWQHIADESQGIFIEAVTAPDPSVNDPGGNHITTLLDPRNILWDEAQRSEIWRMDMEYNKACNGNLSISGSPLRSILQANYGYCISVHQSQGSEFDGVTIFWDPMMLRMNSGNAVRWLYTAVTRAAKRVCIVTI